MQHTGCYMMDVHQGLGQYGAVGLADSLSQRFRHFCEGVSDVDLATGDVVRAPVKRQAAGQA